MLVTVFMDRPVLADILRQTTDCQILSAADLNAPLSRANLSDLGAAEHKQIRYWKPATGGELLFNYCD
jgi:hypothetical protein